jgi:hypothetical protein
MSVSRSFGSRFSVQRQADTFPDEAFLANLGKVALYQNVKRLRHVRKPSRVSFE